MFRDELERLRWHLRLTDSNENLVRWSLDRFPDGQIRPKWNYSTTGFRLKASVVDSVTLDLFLQIIQSGALSVVEPIVVNYLYGARSDRGSEKVGEIRVTTAPTCQTIIEALRLSNYSHRYLVPHCWAQTTQLVHAENISLLEVFEENLLNEEVLVFPDKSAQTRTGPLSFGAVSFVCEKQRENGEVSQTTPFQQTDIEGKRVVVLDDLCDGGRSFTSLAARIRDKRPRSLKLCICHGVFSNDAPATLASYYDKIIVSNSLPQVYQWAQLPHLEIVNVW